MMEQKQLQNTLAEIRQQNDKFAKDSDTINATKRLLENQVSDLEREIDKIKKDESSHKKTDLHDANTIKKLTVDNTQLKKHIKELEDEIKALRELDNIDRYAF